MEKLATEWPWRDDGRSTHPFFRRDPASSALFRRVRERAGGADAASPDLRRPAC